MGKSYFIGSFPAIARGLTSTTAVDWHLKVKHIEFDVCVIKNYCITFSMQKIISIHTLIQQILGSHELNAMPIFDHARPNRSKTTFSFLEFTPASKKSVIPSIHSQDRVNFRVLRPNWPHPFLTMSTHKF